MVLGWVNWLFTPSHNYRSEVLSACIMDVVLSEAISHLTWSTHSHDCTSRHPNGPNRTGKVLLRIKFCHFPNLPPTSLRKAAIHEMETFRSEHLPIDSSRCNVRLRTASTGLPAGGTQHGWLKYVCCTNKRWTGLKLNCDWHLKFIFATAETVGRSVPPLMLQPKWKSCQLLVCCASTGRGSRVKCKRLGDVEVYKPFTWGWPVYIVKIFAIISI